MTTLATDRTGLRPGLALLGGIAVSRLQVYEGRAPDGLAGGSPHLHLACAEAYIVLEGAGSVELLSLSHGYQCLALGPGDALQFDPGVVHRLVNDGGLELLVLMQNGGLPENGDAIFTFPQEILEDVEAYRRHTAIDSIEGALARRDLAVQGMILLKEGFGRSLNEGRNMLSDLHRRAARLAGPSARIWPDIVDSGPGAALAETRSRVEKLLRGQSTDLANAQVSHVVRTAETVLGMCGRLKPLTVERTPLAPEAREPSPSA